MFFKIDFFELVFYDIHITFLVFTIGKFIGYHFLLQALHNKFLKNLNSRKQCWETIEVFLEGWPLKSPSIYLYLKVYNI